MPKTEFTQKELEAYLKGKGVLAKHRAQQKRKKIVKPVNIYALEHYWCTECGRIHKRYRKSDGKKIKIYYDHKEYAQKISEAELFRIRFKKGWRKEAAKQKKTGKAVGTPKKDKGRRRYG